MSAMAKDPYATLGVQRTATADDIKAAFRKLAKKHHPDLNPGNKTSEAKFKAASAANELLSDPEKRARFDRGEIDAEGQATAPPGYRHYAEGEQAGRYRGGGTEDDAFGDIFADLFRQAGGGPGGGGRGARPARGEDQHFSLTIPFTEAALGGTRRITMPEGRGLDVAIPPGVRDGQTIRLRGQGHPGWNGGPPGDALIEVGVAPHAFFRRDGDDIHLELPVTVAEAVLGGKVDVPTLSGKVSLTVPPHSDAGRKLRLRGKGIPAHGQRPAGDLYVTLKLVVGTPDTELEDALRAWAERNSADPRAHMQEGA
jgi:DnaJ-class molecular chaperone